MTVRIAAVLFVAAVAVSFSNTSQAAKRVADPQKKAAFQGEFLAVAAVRVTLCESERRRDAGERMIAEARAAVAPHKELRILFQAGYERGRKTELLIQGEDWFRSTKCGDWEENLREAVEEVHKLVNDYELDQLGK